MSNIDENSVLIVIDMQHDFIDGALKNDDAKAIIEPMGDYIRNKFPGKYILFTRDTHHDDYMQTQEGKLLPVVHCIEGSPGWIIEKSLWKSACLNTNVLKTEVYDKPTFGAAHGIADFISVNFENVQKIIIIGTCTDICVVSNALGLKSEFPEIPIEVIGSLCAGLTPEKHDAALNVMQSCQIFIK